MQTAGIASLATELKQSMSVKGPSGQVSQLTQIFLMYWLDVLLEQVGKILSEEEWVFTISLQQALFQTKPFATH